MKKILLTIALFTSAAVTARSAVNSADPAMAPYVYPGNATAKVAAPVYLPDGSAMVAVSADGKRIVTIDIESGKELETVFDTTTTRENKIDAIEGFTLSPDGKSILVWNGREPVYRRSFTASYWTYDRHSRILMPLSEKFKRQRSPIFSPDGLMVAFTADDNNIHIRKLDYKTEVDVTTDGKVNAIINGVPDWTYEEEFATTCSMAWAPDNLTLCFIKYNEKDVPLYRFPLYEGACNPDKEYALYPGMFEYKYPVAGMVNSKVTLHSYDVETRKLKQIELPDSRIEYIPRMDYSPDPAKLIVTTLNRDQNRMEIYGVNPRATTCTSLIVEENTTGWIQPCTYEGLSLQPEFIVMMSDRSGYTQLYQYSYSGALQRQLTNADYDVTAYYGYSAATRSHYFQSTGGNPVNRVVNRLDAKGVTTVISPEEGNSAATFGPGMERFMLCHSSVSTPPRYTLHASARPQKALRVFEDNAKAAKEYASAPRREFFTMPASGDRPELNGYIIKPAGFDASQRYPAIMYQYSGPGSQEVLNRWVIDWENYFAMKGYVIVCVDGRGTGGRGKAFREIVYRNLGHIETVDQLAAARHAASLPFVDPARIGIFGWSYGGYETLMAASAPDNPYKAAVAVAPVTDWRYYDTVYAERYMLTPAQNEHGYETSAPINRIDGMQCNLLIMSGTADDNVHLSNTIEYVSRLVQAGKWCDLMLFPNMNHSINGCDARRVVYGRMLDYFNRNL